MAKVSKRMRELRGNVDLKKLYSLEEAVKMAKLTSKCNFSPSFDVVFKLNLDPTKAEQQLRGCLTLPFAVVKNKIILVLADDFDASTLKSAGADFVGGVEYLTKIKEGWLGFDLMITTSQMMPEIAKLGKLLGPRGLMPNPKLGTVTNDLLKTVVEFKKGKVEYRTDAYGNIHMQIGKIDFTDEQLVENVNFLKKFLLEKKPAHHKGVYFQSISVSTTMGLGFKIQL